MKISKEIPRLIWDMNRTYKASNPIRAADCLMKLSEGLHVVVLPVNTVWLHVLTWASITKTRAEQPPNIDSESNVGSIMSNCPGKSQIYNTDKDTVISAQHTWNCTKELWEISAKNVVSSSLRIQTIFHNFARELKEQCLVGRHFVKDDFLDRRFPASNLVSTSKNSKTHRFSPMRRTRGFSCWIPALALEPL